MDFNGDGHMDIISGSYMPGNLYIFHGKGDGQFAKARKIVDAGGRELFAGTGPVGAQQYDMESLAAVPFAADMDADGDYDLLVGNISGRVILIENQGSKTDPRYTRKTTLTAGGQPITVPGGDAGPVVADWDGDGAQDLIVGAGDGSVWFYKNTGSNKAAEYAAGTPLIKSDPQHAYRQFAIGEEPCAAGSRTKVCVVDYNEDGKLDLLVGDFCIQERSAPNLTEEQIKLRDELMARQSDVQMRMSEEMSKIIEDVGQENLASIDFTKQEKYMAISEEFSEIMGKLQPLQAGTATHGFVWLYQQK